MVSVDDAETNKKFATEHEADFPILSDPEKGVAKAYGVLGQSGLASRWTFYIGRDGKILFIEKQGGQAQTVNAGDSLVKKLEELATKGLVGRK
jgi:thioredoxin-dependent peroxiredoxin